MTRGPYKKRRSNEDSGTKRCSGCGHEQPLDEFVLSARDGRINRCKTCTAHYHRKRLYGISAEDYLGMLASQNGCCATCYKAPATGRSLFVDHDHVTGSVRGLLCGKCNSALGQVGDDPEVLRNLIEYLHCHSTIRLV